jgi:4-carboxymuconolactone decarboxylase
MRIPPLAHDQWTDEVREILASFSKEHSEFGLNGDESEKDRLSPILSTVLQTMPLARTYFPFAQHLLRNSSLEVRHTRIVVLRVAWNWGFELEWAQHAALAVTEDILVDEEIRRVIKGPDAEGWTPLEALLLRAVDQARTTMRVDDAVWNELAEHLSIAQLSDLTFTIGGYILAGLYMNLFGLPMPDDLKGFKDFV